VRIGPYSLHGTIAAGGFGQVDYATTDDGRGGTRLVAVKRMRADRSNDEALAMLADEARLVSRIRHPNVIGVLDVIHTENELFVVMEYVDGETLAFFLRRAQKLRDPIPLPIVSAIVVGALEGLHAAHEAVDENGAPLGIVHRDVSLPNIMVGTDGRARLLDFGVAKAEGRLQSTSIGELKGKLAYMAPEQLALEPVTPRSDLYAVGVVLWELIASRRLFDSPDGATTIEKVLKGPVDPPSRYASNVPLALEQLVLRSLSRNPAERYATGAEMAAELAACIEPAEAAEIGQWVEAAGEDTAAKRRPALPGRRPPMATVPDAQLADETINEVVGRHDPRLRIAALVAAGVLLLAAAVVVVVSLRSRGSAAEAEDSGAPALVDPDAASVLPVAPPDLPEASALAPLADASVPAPVSSAPPAKKAPRRSPRWLRRRKSP
jgi:hypothetical protein